LEKCRSWGMMMMRRRGRFDLKNDEEDDVSI
jgi:hypothetical protein